MPVSLVAEQPPIGISSTCFFHAERHSLTRYTFFSSSTATMQTTPDLSRCSHSVILSFGNLTFVEITRIQPFSNSTFSDNIFGAVMLSLLILHFLEFLTQYFLA